MQILINRTHGIFDISTKGFRYLIDVHGWPVKTPQSLEELDQMDASMCIIDLSVVDPELKYDFLEEDLFSLELRTDYRLIDMFKQLGNEANTEVTKLHIIEIDEDVIPRLINMGGMEWVVDANRSWPKIERSLVDS